MLSAASFTQSNFGEKLRKSFIDDEATRAFVLEQGARKNVVPFPALGSIFEMKNMCWIKRGLGCHQISLKDGGKKYREGDDENEIEAFQKCARKTPFLPNE